MPPILTVIALLVPLVTQAEPEQQSGWLCRIGTDGPTFRTAHAAFVLEEDKSLHPLAPPLGLVTFETLLEIEDDGVYRFQFTAVNGDVQLEVLGWDGELIGRSGELKTRTDPLDLKAGEVRFVVQFRRCKGTDLGPQGESGPAPGISLLQVDWEREFSTSGGFHWEPIPTSATRLPEDALAAATASTRTLRGRVLLEERGCTNCHTPPEGAEYAVGRRTAPDLTGIGARADLDWLTSWIRDPQAHGAIGMPRLVEADAEREITALSHYVASLDVGDNSQTGWAGATEFEVIARGRELYHQVGCVACHGALESAAAVFSDAYLSADLPIRGEVPLDGRANKWRASALAEFLRDPSATRSGSRMPSLGLSESEADFIANYLVDKLGAGSPRPLDPSRVEEGRVLFTARGCAACHEVEGAELQPMTGAPALDALDTGRGCLDAKGAGPRHALSNDELEAITFALAELSGASFSPAPIDAAERRMLALRCTACHERNGEGGVAEDLDVFFRATDERVDLGDEGRLPPDLTGVGTKLQHQWLAQVVSEGAQARPYLGVRMPHFGDVGTEIASGLSSAEAAPPGHDRQAPMPTDASIRTGRELLGPESFNCMTCHVYGEFPATGSPGPSITQFAERLRYGWFSSYMHNPQRYKPGGRMPDFSIAGRSSLTAVLDGDLTRQIDAMWSYFGLGEFMPAPDGVEPGAGFALPVGDRPVVHRGFLLDVGSRGIAVGLPVGVHFAFDARTCRLVHAWKGAFVDASGSWAGRGGSELGGQGPIVWEAKEGPTFEHFYHDEVEPEFLGYRLDADGWPTFQWALHDVIVHESFDATLAPELVITRRFEFENLSGVGLGGPRLDPDGPPPRASGGMIWGERHGYLLLTADDAAERPTIEWEVRP